MQAYPAQSQFALNIRDEIPPASAKQTGAACSGATSSEYHAGDRPCRALANQATGSMVIAKHDCIACTAHVLLCRCTVNVEG
jgi:hypothetical protein